MKKIISFLIAFVSIFSLCGCQANLNNTPTKQVEIFLGKYQTLDKDILDDLDKVIAEEESFNASQRDTYRGIMKKHYQDLEYNVKDEKIDGDRAFVTVEIEVDDYSKVLKEASDKLTETPEEFNDDNGKYSHTKYVDYQLDLMKKNKDTVKYTLELTLTKKDKKWVMDNLTTTDMEKINGIYNY